MLKHKRLWAAALVGVGVALLLAVWSADDGTAQADSTAGAPAMPEVGAPGTFFGPLATVFKGPPPAPTAPTPDALSDVDRLWPHVRLGPPSAQERAHIRAQWVNLSARYPDNLYIPSEFRPPLNPAQRQQARAQLDDTTAMAARMAAQKHADRFAAPPSVGDAAQRQVGAGTAPSEQQAREAGVSPAQQRNFFNYQIRELESRIQLVEFYLAADDMVATKKAAAQKEVRLWKKELEELNRLRAQIPAS
jgi:hypothetical protein